jgi:ribA/ribD-fused uncharacterized protein
MVNLVVPKFEGNHFFLSNFYEFPVEYPVHDQIKVLRTNEHAFQAAKYKAMDEDWPLKQAEYFESVVKAKTPGEAKGLGRKVKIDAAKWDSIKIDVMREVCWNKFKDESMKALLLSTGPAMLVEGNTWGDKFWGRCDGHGYNMLGVILMEIRGYWKLVS